MPKPVKMVLALVAFRELGHLTSPTRKRRRWISADAPAFRNLGARGALGYLSEPCWLTISGAGNGIINEDAQQAPRDGHASRA